MFVSAAAPWACASYLQKCQGYIEDHADALKTDIKVYWG